MSTVPAIRTNVGVEAGNGGERPAKGLVDELLQARSELATGHVDQSALHGCHRDPIGSLYFGRCPGLRVVNDNLLRSQLAQRGDFDGVAH